MKAQSSVILRKISQLLNEPVASSVTIECTIKVYFRNLEARAVDFVFVHF